MRRSIALLILMALLLSSCTRAAKKIESAPGTVRVLVIGMSGLETSLVTAFQAAQPQLKVESVALPEGDFPTIAEKIRSGETKVDAIVSPGNPFLFTQGLVTPMDDLIKQNRLDISPYGNSLELGKFQNKTYGLTVSVNPMLVMYNKELFTQAGLSIPKPGWTWEEFEADAAALTKTLAGNEKALGAAMPPWSFADLFLTAGKGPADPDLSALQSTLTRYQRMSVVDKLLDVSPLQPSDSEYFLAFARGEIGMLVNYWGSIGHGQPKFDWGIAPMPGSDRVPGIATLAMVAAKAENPQGAFAFDAFVAGTTGAQAVAKMPGAPVPSFVDETVKNLWLAAAGPKDDASFVFKQKYVPTAEYPEQLANLLLKEVDATLKGQKTPEQAIEAYKQAREPVLSKK
jgi:multiple sugar transport system substrate-binding protein